MRPEPPARKTFTNLPSGMRDAPNTRKVYSLGLALAEECPDNDCRVYLNIFNMARELDEALDKVKPNSAPFLALRSALSCTVIRYLSVYPIRPHIVNIFGRRTPDREDVGVHGLAGAGPGHQQV